MSNALLTRDRRLRIFLSADAGELSAERDALAKAIRQEIGFLPVFAQAETRPHPRREVFIPLIEQSDVFVGIYGKKYGWIDADCGATVSGIHEEWRHAAKLPRLAFVKHPSVNRDHGLHMLLSEIEAASGARVERFRSRKQLIELARERIASVVSERFLSRDIPAAQSIAGSPISDESCVLGKTIETDFFSNIALPAVNSASRIIIVGTYGSGKTTTMQQLRARLGGIYVSLRNMSLLGSLVIIGRELSADTNLPAPSFSSPDDGLRVCESLLARTTTNLFIDDLEHAEGFAYELSRLSAGSSRLIFASRAIPADFPPDFKVIAASGFSFDEAARYVEERAPATSLTRREAAVRRSDGNPLYLNYFAEFPHTEPPASLAEYHAIRWERLDHAAQELIAVIATSQVKLRFDDVARALGAYRHRPTTGIEVHRECVRLASLIIGGADTIQLSHPSFGEYVVAWLKESMLSSSVHLALAEAFAQSGDYQLRIYHSVCAGVEVYPDVLAAGSWAAMTGRIRMARVLLATAMRAARRRGDFHTLGLALYESSVLTHHSTSPLAALRISRLAQDAFRRVSEAEWVLICRTTEATFLVDLGRGVEAIASLKDAASHWREQRYPLGEAAARANLSYVFVRQGRTRETEEECLRAMELFKALGDTYGYAVALLNLQTVYISRKDRPRQISCIQRLFSIARQLDAPRFAAAALNGLTILHRREKRYNKAEVAARRGVEIAESLGDWHLLAKNIGNLGNVYRDQERLIEARQCYQRTLDIGITHQIKSAIAFGKEQLASVMEVDDLDSAIVLGNESATLYRELGDAHRLAATEDDQGSRYRSKSDRRTAEDCFHAAAEAWIASGLPTGAAESANRAIALYLEMEAFEEAASAFQRTWRRLVKPGSESIAAALMEVAHGVGYPLLQHLTPGFVLDVPALLPGLMRQSEVLEVVRLAAGICKRFGDPTAGLQYVQFLLDLLSRYSAQPSDELLAAIAIGVEQLSTQQFEAGCADRLFDQIGLKITGIAHRRDRLIGERWVIFFPAPFSPAVEIRTRSQAPPVRAAGWLAALLICAGRKAIAEQLSAVGWQEIGYTIIVMSEAEGTDFGVAFPDLRPLDVPIAFMGVTAVEGEERLPDVMLVRDDFIGFSDWEANPENKAAVWMLLHLYDFILRRFSHDTITTEESAPARCTFIRSLLGMVVKQDQDSLSAASDDPLPGIEASFADASSPRRRGDAAAWAMAFDSLPPPNTKTTEQGSVMKSDTLPPESVDVGIVIALKEEFEVIHEEIQASCQVERDEESGTYYYLFERPGVRPNRPYRCVATFAGEMGPTKAALITQRLLSRWHPEIIVNIGIAAGLSNDIAVGDVVVATAVDKYLDRAKAVAKKKGGPWTLERAGEVYRASPSVVGFVRNFEFAHKERFQKWVEECSAVVTGLLSVEETRKLVGIKAMRPSVRLLDGHLASGDIVGTASSFSAWLKGRDRSYLALEMEAGGVLAAVHESVDQKHALVIRGISDLGDERKSKLDKIGGGGLRRWAMTNSVQLLWSLMANGGLPRADEVL